MSRGNRNKMVPSSSSSAKQGGGSSSWSFADHSNRLEKKLSKKSSLSSRRSKDSDDSKERFAYRRQFLARDTSATKERSKTKLHITKLEREICSLRKRLTMWDDVEEAKREEEGTKRRAAAAQEADAPPPLPKRRRLRPGPETWKLRGAARPAHEVYDFDTRYVDPFKKEHEEHAAKVKRSRNLLALYRGHFGATTAVSPTTASSSSSSPLLPPPPPICRTFLSLISQLGHLCVEAKRFKTAREAFKECLELEGDDVVVTNARDRLMRLYLEANRPDSARRLWESFSASRCCSVWIRYSAVLVEYVSWNLQGETGSDRTTTLARLVEAVSANVFCAHYLANHDTFQQVMEYTEDVEDLDCTTTEEKLLQAIEYCNSEQMGAWIGTEGALEWLQQEIRTVLSLDQQHANVDALKKEDLEWSTPLAKVEDDYREISALEGEDEDDEDEHEEKKEEFTSESKQDDEDDKPLDVLMYAEMFRTAMEMSESVHE